MSCRRCRGTLEWRICRQFLPLIVVISALKRNVKRDFRLINLRREVLDLIRVAIRTVQCLEIMVQIWSGEYTSTDPRSQREQFVFEREITLHNLQTTPNRNDDAGSRIYGQGCYDQ